MEEITLELQKRDVTGKAVKRLRQAGMVPGVIHDHGKNSVNVQLDYQSAAKAYSTAGRHHPLQLEAAGEKYTALIKNVTLDPKHNSMTHIVFNAIKANEKVQTAIPVRARFDEGNDVSPAERAGLIVLTNLESVEVKALPKNLPDVLEFDGEKLIAVGDHITVADLIVPAGVEIETAPEQALATVYEPSALQAANEDAGGDAEEAAPAGEPSDAEQPEEGSKKSE